MSATDLEARLRRVEDTFAIQQLRATYCQTLDDNDWDGLMDTFTPDGAFVGLSTARGHADLRAFFSELVTGSLSKWWHFSSNETVELDGDRATGQTWLLQPCVVDEKAQIAAGRYSDTMVRCPDGRWRFEERRVTFFFWVDSESDWRPGRFDYPGARAASDHTVR